MFGGDGVGGGAAGGGGGAGIIRSARPRAVQPARAVVEEAEARVELRGQFHHRNAVGEIGGDRGKELAVLRCVRVSGTRKAGPLGEQLCTLGLRPNKWSF